MRSGRREGGGELGGREGGREEEGRREDIILTIASTLSLLIPACTKEIQGE